MHFFPSLHVIGYSLQSTCTERTIYQPLGFAEMRFKVCILLCVTSTGLRTTLNKKNISLCEKEKVKRFWPSWDFCNAKGTTVTARL